MVGADYSSASERYVSPLLRGFDSSEQGGRDGINRKVIRGERCFQMAICTLKLTKQGAVKEIKKQMQVLSVDMSRKVCLTSWVAFVLISK